MDVESLYVTINKALVEEQNSGVLARYIDRRTPFLHPAIELEAQSSDEQLIGFVHAYISQVPQLLLQGWQYCQADEYNWLRMALLTARRLFQGRRHSVLTLANLLTRAYLTHRLMEEVNDRFIHQLGYSLLGLDTTRANLVAYELLGDCHANRLDSTVMVLAAQLSEGISNEWPLCEEHGNVRHLETWRNRSCLSQQSGVKLTWRVA